MQRPRVGGGEEASVTKPLNSFCSGDRICFPGLLPCPISLPSFSELTQAAPLLACVRCWNTHLLGGDCAQRTGDRGTAAVSLPPSRRCPEGQRLGCVGLGPQHFEAGLRVCSWLGVAVNWTWRQVSERASAGTYLLKAGTGAPDGGTPASRGRKTAELRASPPSCPEPPQQLSHNGDPGPTRARKLEKYVAEAAFLKVNCSVQLRFPREQKGRAGEKEPSMRECVYV